MDNAGQLVVLQLHVRPESPRNVMHGLAQLGTACVSMDPACRPRMGCTAADRDSIVGRLVKIQKVLSGESPTDSDQRA